MKKLSCLELFSGAGGLAIGIHEAGFRHAALVELNRSAYATLDLNQKNGFKAFEATSLINADVSKYDFTEFKNKIDLIAGGPPCQPFSGAGKGLGIDDHRDMFPSATKLIRLLEPKAFIFENVRGITRPKFHNYLEYIKLRLEFPHYPISERQSWQKNLLALQKHKTSTNQHNDLCYRVFTQLVNAADYGIPQKRFRFFIIGFRSDINANWNFPEATHSQQALHYTQFVTNDYWQLVGLKSKKIEPLKSAPNIAQQELFSVLQPWKTVRQAISDLPTPRSRAAQLIPNHEYRAGARSYPGHTGSILDEPSKTLKAGDHGVPGGENMILFPNGKVRYFSMRECARLQTFPDDYIFHGNWVDTVKQLGNAVPVELARILSNSIKKALLGAESKTQTL